MFGKPTGCLLCTLRQPPHAWAELRGEAHHPKLTGRAHFYQTPWGVLIALEVLGLPSPQGACESPVFGLHIHEGHACTGPADDPFADAGGHYNPEGCLHPHHAGDLPPLFGNHGYTFQTFLTDRFSLGEVMGRTLILHGHPDDFTSQPAGHAGERIACGIIQGRSPRC